jgi:hypothetical protein
MRFKPIIILAAGLALAACTTATADQSAANTPADGRDCFRTQDVAGYQTIDDHSIRVRISGNRTYTLATNWNVYDLDWTHAIQLRSSSGWICTGNVFGSVEVIGGTYTRSYPINTVTRDPVTPADQGS